MCPVCRNPDARIKKKGFFTKKSTRTERVQRYYCHDCRRSFSDQTHRLTYNAKRPHLDQPIYRWVCSGVSQRRIAINLGTTPRTVARKIMRLARFARAEEERWSLQNTGSAAIMFDEMETFEHTKCKPITIAIACDPKTRRLIATEAQPIAANGRLAKISRKKYGFRRNGSPDALRKTFERLKQTYDAIDYFSSDQKTTYRRYTRSYFPGTPHEQFKGRRACTVGMGEMKKGGFDPLFMLNHSCAMNRDNLKTLTRRTWCTVKKLAGLQDLLDLYRHYHNRTIVDRIRAPRVCGDPIWCIS